MSKIKTLFFTFVIFLPLLFSNGGDGMTQESRPQPGRSTSYPDAGPYSSDQWAKLLSVLHLGDRNTSAGVVAAYDVNNRLGVTNPAGVTIRVASGGAIVDGHLYLNSANVDITPSTPSGNRMDRVVLVLNNTTSVYSTNLDLPSDYPTGIPAYSVRLAILRGDTAAYPSPRALVQTASCWMIELAQYAVSNVPAVSSLTDTRSYMDAETKTVFVPALIGYNYTSGAEIPLATYIGAIAPKNGPSIPLADSAICAGYANWIVPQDYISSLRIRALVLGPNGNNIYAKYTGSHGAIGETYNTHDDDGSYAAEALGGADTLTLHSSASPANVTAADVFSMAFARSATSPSDTVGDIVRFIGFQVNYLGYRR